jgi:HAD superfamily hydrolase (TIGR01509 family)
VKVKTLWLRQPYLDQILAGDKTVEVRVGYDNIRRLQPGDRLHLNGRHLAEIRRVAHYDDFEALVAAEDADAIAPGLAPDELLQALRNLYGPKKEALGAVALEVTLCRYDAVLFDMGYTLVYFVPTQEEVVREALRALGAEHSLEEIRQAVEVVWGEYYRDAETETFPATEEYDQEASYRLSTALLAELGLPSDPETWETYNEVLEEGFRRPGALRPYPETVAVLDQLRALGYRMGIISNWSWNLRRRVAQAGLDGYFEFVWASAYAGCNKPHPCIFEQALRQMELAPDRALYVGDSYRHDVGGARRAGLDPILVVRDGDARDYDCPVIPDLSALPSLLAPSASGSPQRA